MQLVRAISRMHISPYQMLIENTLWPADDPLVVQHPDWFTADLEPIINRTAGTEPKRKAPRNVAVQQPDEVVTR